MKTFYCDICYQTMRGTSKNRHLNSKRHIRLSKCITVKYTIPKQDILNTENIIKKLIEDYNEKFNIYGVSFLIKQKESSTKLYALNIAIDQSEYNFLNEIINQNETREIDIYFVTEFRHIRYNHYIKQPKSMLEWVLLKKIHNQIIIKDLDITPVPIHLYENNTFCEMLT